jgi:3-oxoacid CoA-transferase A subunit
MDKLVTSIDDAVADIPDGASIAMGGFFTCGIPVYLTHALLNRKIRNLTIISMAGAVGNVDIDALISQGQVSKIIASYPFYRSVEKGRQHICEQMARADKISIEVYPMGTLAEKLRAGGAGIAGFYTLAGVGTVVSQGKETKVFDGKTYLLEKALKPDFAFVHAWKCDHEGNTIYRKTARSFNHVMAMSAKESIVESENVSDSGTLDPNFIHTPGVYVHRVVKIDRPKIKIGID